MNLDIYKVNDSIRQFLIGLYWCKQSGEVNYLRHNEIDILVSLSTYILIPFKKWATTATFSEKKAHLNLFRKK